MPKLPSIRTEFHKLANPVRAKTSAWFFKTEPGQYGHGDRFLGIPVPRQRQLARKYRGLSLREIVSLLKSPIHEHRLTALFMLVDRYQQGNENIKQQTVRAYIAHTKYINNWDLVDSSASYILGRWLFKRPRRILYKFARSKALWERRISIISTAAFIDQDQYRDTLAIAKILLSDQHDLIHKAVGWMLREVGKRNRSTLVKFLQRHAGQMPRTMLRYAIEKFPATQRQAWLRYRN